MVFQGHIENGVAVFDEPTTLPDGMKVCIVPVVAPPAEDGVRKTLAERFKNIIGAAESTRRHGRESRPLSARDVEDECRVCGTCSISWGRRTPRQGPRKVPGVLAIVGRLLITTSWVLMEVGDAFSRARIETCSCCCSRSRRGCVNDGDRREPRAVRQGSRFFAARREQGMVAYRSHIDGCHAGTGRDGAPEFRPLFSTGRLSRAARRVRQMSSNGSRAHAAWLLPCAALRL